VDPISLMTKRGGKIHLRRYTYQWLLSVIVVAILLIRSFISRQNNSYSYSDSYWNKDTDKDKYEYQPGDDSAEILRVQAPTRTNINIAPLPRARVLLGIHCEDLHLQRQIRDTYLRYYHTNSLGFPTNTLCPLSSLHDDCRIIYTFYQTGKPNSCTAKDDNDILCLGEAHNNTSSRDPSTIEWFRHARTLNFQWMGHVDATCMLQPPLLVDVLDRYSDTPSGFASTPFINLMDCLDKNFRQSHSLQCRQQPSGRVYWMSKDMVDHLLQRRQWSHEEVDLDVAIRTWITQNYHPLQIDIPKQPLVLYKDWSRLWNELNTPTISTSNTTAWRDLPVTYITAKFGRHHEFQHDVEERRRTVIWNYGWKTSQIFSYSQYPTWILQDPRWKQHLAFRNNESLPDRGAGFWFWKGPLIIHHLRQSTWIIYADVDLWDHLEWIVDLMTTLQNGNYDLALYQLPYLEHEWTKPKVYQHFCGDRQDLFQYSANFLVIRNAPQTLKLVEDWTQAMSRYEWINDHIINERSPDNFQEHRHDQSLLSVLLNCRYSVQTERFSRATTLNDWTVQMVRLKGEDSSVDREQTGH
jgi:hypothetical protein